MSRRSSRLAAIGTAVPLIALIIFLGVGLASSQSKARREVVGRFSDHAAISASLTYSLVKTVASTMQATDATLYRSARVTPAALLAAARSEQSVNLVMLDSNGSILASSTGTPAAVTRLLREKPDFVREALADHGFAVSNLLTLGGGPTTIELAQPFQTAYGERVLVRGVPLSTFSVFMDGFLAESSLRTEAHSSSEGFIVDGHGSMMATSAGSFQSSSAHMESGLVAAALHHSTGSSGHGSFFVASRIPMSPWVVVLTAPEGKLFASVSGQSKWLPWILFIAFTLVSVLALVLLMRNAAAQRVARAEADRANRAKSEFLSRMSHELRTPLNSVIGFAQLLELDELDSGQREGVEQILRAGRHLLDLINEVLDISRIEAGTLAMSLEPVHLGSVLAEALSLISPLAAEAGVRLVADPADLGDVHVRADHQRLKQVLINLLSNAVKYNRAGGEIGVHSDEPAEGRFGLSITDTGKGLTDEQIERLFEPFDRLDETETEGTGLGLAVSLRLMEAMDGTIKAESQRGAGTTMRVELARVRGPEEEAQAEPAREADDGAPRCTIVYVEDNLSNFKLVERLVERAPGVRLIPAMQGRMGVDLTRQHHPDLVLLDLHLPDINGREALEQLKRDPATADIPIVILSADATPGQVARLKKAGATDYLTKPIDVEMLLAIILRILPARVPELQAASSSGE